MHLHQTVHRALWVPVAVLFVPYFYSLVVMWTNPASSLQDRGAGVLGIVVILAVLVELAAIATSLWLLLTDEEYRTARSIILTTVGLAPMLLALMLGATVLYGHG